MTINFNPLTWNWNEAKAAGKHVLSYSAGIVTAAAMWGLISQTDSSALMGALNDLFNGLEQVVKSIGVLAGILIPIYTSLRAAHNASPNKQVDSVVKNLASPEASSQVGEASRTKLIDAVAKMSEVKGIVADEPIAKATESPKVVASPEEVKVS